MTTKIVTIKTRTQIDLLRQTPSALFRAARSRSGAGVHADNGGRYNKRNRARHRADERRALADLREAE